MLHIYLCLVISILQKIIVYGPEKSNNCIREWKIEEKTHKRARGFSINVYMCITLCNIYVYNCTCNHKHIIKSYYQNNSLFAMNTYVRIQTKTTSFVFRVKFYRIWVCAPYFRLVWNILWYDLIRLHVLDRQAKCVKEMLKKGTK